MNFVAVFYEKYIAAKSMQWVMRIGNILKGFFRKKVKSMKEIVNVEA